MDPALINNKLGALFGVSLLIINHFEVLKPLYDTVNRGIDAIRDERLFFLTATIYYIF
jgi:hypothetical protein